MTSTAVTLLTTSQRPAICIKMQDALSDILFFRRSVLHLKSDGCLSFVLCGDAKACVGLVDWKCLITAWQEISQGCSSDRRQDFDSWIEISRCLRAGLGPELDLIDCASLQQ